MKNKTLALLLNVALAFSAAVVSVGLQAQSEFGSRVTSSDFRLDASMGMRSAEFQAAPDSRQMWLYETRIGATQQILPGSPLFAGVALSYLDMRGEMGPGLRALNGLAIAPHLGLRQRFGFVEPFGVAGVRVAQLFGRGSENWDDNTSGALFLFRDDAVEQKRKSFVSSGAHAALGSAFVIDDQVRLLAELQLGFERLANDTRVIADGVAKARRNTAFNSQAIVLGAQVSL